MEEIIDDGKDVEDVRSCVINIPKYRVFAKRSKDLIKICPNRNPLKVDRDNRFRKPSETTLKKYTLPQAKPLPVKYCGKDEILLSFRQFAKQEQRLRHRQRMAIKFNKEYKIRNVDLRKRIYAEDPSDDVTALTDIDKHYFNFVNGRPLVHRGGYYKSIPYFYNYRLMKKIETGYRLDTISNIDVNYAKQQEEYRLSVERYTKQTKSFDQFISEDYKKSMACLAKWEEVKTEVFLKNMELESLSNEIFMITSRLICLDYVYILQQKYGRFLYYLSPSTWRAQNRDFARSIEIEAEGFNPAGWSEEDSFSAIFDKMKRECARTFVKSVLFFKNPTDLIGVFETLEMQQQYQFAHVCGMVPLIKCLHIGISNVRDIIRLDSASVASCIEGFEALIKFYTERSQQLENKFMKILHGLFFESVGTLDVLKFNVHLEFCYEKVFKEKPINMDIVAMAKAIESMYFDYQMRLEKLSGDSVKRAIKDNIRDGKLKLKKAKEAARELRLFERLKHELKVSCGPVIKQEGKIILSSTSEAAQRRLPRSEIKQKKCKVKPKIDKKSLTESELDYLRLFTDWTENEDPGLYLLSHTN